MPITSISFIKQSIGSTIKLSVIYKKFILFIFQSEYNMKLNFSFVIV